MAFVRLNDIDPCNPYITPIKQRVILLLVVARHAERGPGQMMSLPGGPGTQRARPARLCQFFHDFIECTSICDDSR